MFFVKTTALLLNNYFYVYLIISYWHFAGAVEEEGEPHTGVLISLCDAEGSPLHSQHAQSLSAGEHHLEMSASSLDASVVDSDDQAMILDREVIFLEMLKTYSSCNNLYFNF